MFNQLYKLCKKEDLTGRKPLEDFTTEAFAGLLRMHTNVRAVFLFDILDLPKNDAYSIYTQRSYPANHSIIDIVIEGEKNICFIESKVESKENEGQLEKYIKLLDKLKKEQIGLKTKLVYCTKKYDPKPECKDYHNFQDIRWYEIANMLKAFQDQPLVNNFLKFLKRHKMMTKSVYSLTEFQAMGNLKHTMEMLQLNLSEAKPKFKELFTKKGSFTVTEDKFGKKYDHNRWIYMIEKIAGSKGHSDFTYGFYLDTPSIYVGLYIKKGNTKYTTLKALETQISGNELTLEERKNDDGQVHGLVIKLEQDISYLLNNEEANTIIKDWYETSFETFDSFFKETKEIGWKFL